MNFRNARCNDKNKSILVPVYTVIFSKYFLQHQMGFSSSLVFLKQQPTFIFTQMWNFSSLLIVIIRALQEVKTNLCLFTCLCLRRLIIDVSRSHKIRHTHAHPVGLLWTNAQLVTEVATYPTNNKHKGKISINSAGFESVIPEIRRLQTYALDHTDIQVCRVTYIVAVFTLCLKLQC
jgi:hypothetical protein